MVDFNSVWTFELGEYILFIYQVESRRSAFEKQKINQQSDIKQDKLGSKNEKLHHLGFWKIEGSLSASSRNG